MELFYFLHLILLVIVGGGRSFFYRIGLRVRLVDIIKVYIYSCWLFLLVSNNAILYDYFLWLFNDLVVFSSLLFYSIIGYFIIVYYSFDLLLAF